MFKKVVVLLSVVLLSATTAFAAPYVSGNLGIVSAQDSDITEPGFAATMSFDMGFGVNGAVGMEFMPGVRGELELGYRTNDMDKVSALGVSVPIKGDISSLSVMANVFRDFDMGNNFAPFVGGGIGMAKLEADSTDLGGSEDDTVFAFQLAAGVGYELSETLTLDAQYRYFATANPDFAGTEAEYATHNFLVGARFAF